MKKFAHDFSLAELDREGSLASLLRISRLDDSESLTSSLEPGGMMDALPQLLETLHRLQVIPSPTIPNLYDSHSPKCPSNKRKRTSVSQSSTEKVQQWQACQDQVVPEEQEDTAAEVEIQNKRSRSMAPPPPSTNMIEHHQLGPDVSPDQVPVRPSQKHVRVVLRKLKDFPNSRIRVKNQLEETKEMLNIVESVHQQTDGKLTEMRWTRYIIEEDVLRHQKKDRTLVDGTTKLGSKSLQAREWKNWIQENTITQKLHQASVEVPENLAGASSLAREPIPINAIAYRSEGKGWGYWKNMYGPRADDEECQEGVEEEEEGEDEKEEYSESEVEE
ncbi:MAG: hypothetical protein NXY57DRAFT_35362 [Lentinula lateritia]|uniref:Uncharacterized protein n=1 Tax=Lentinula lateritia TaxID=40482 RepID=A0ABQ8VRJ4_9AGAR|nr:MAG: hypothetical protein NXY57DRAFT_35362 [Lentinula lateritia]KAJ4497230.1 hypothetical protein C8R41DRAFT_979896 [Lentinula lateritia]